MSQTTDLDEARARIVALERQLASQTLSDDLSRALIVAGAASTIVAPVQHDDLLEMIVETARQALKAEAASLLLIDPDQGDMYFAVAVGGSPEKLKSLRVPLGHGIVGLVAASGQPMAVSDVQTSPVHAREFDELVKYYPDSILCVPLMLHDQIIGVLELIDKQGAKSFSLDDMNVLITFGGQAAVAVEQSRSHTNIAHLVHHIVAALSELPESEKQHLDQHVDEFAAQCGADPRYRDALTLAALVHRITWRSEKAGDACRTILQGFADYLGETGRSGQ